MSNESYDDGYQGESMELLLPDFIGSHYETHCCDYVILDGKTGELLTKKYLILWVDAKEGYFVEKKKTEKGVEYITHKNSNIQIIKTEDFYNDDDSD